VIYTFLSIEKYNISSLLLIIDIFHIHAHAGTENGADRFVVGLTRDQKFVTADQNNQVPVSGSVGILTIFILLQSL
jgi:hypothetical protein